MHDHQLVLYQKVHYRNKITVFWAVFLVVITESCHTF